MHDIEGLKNMRDKLARDTNLVRHLRETLAAVGAV